jgi:hypothetical protein
MPHTNHNDKTNLKQPQHHTPRPQKAKDQKLAGKEGKDKTKIPAAKGGEVAAPAPSGQPRPWSKWFAGDGGRWFYQARPKVDGSKIIVTVSSQALLDCRHLTAHDRRMGIPIYRGLPVSNPTSRECTIRHAAIAGNASLRRGSNPRSSREYGAGGAPRTEIGECSSSR